MPDRITVSGLTCHLASGAGPSAFGLTPPPPCPVEIDIDIDLRPDVVPHCVDEDDMRGLGVNYSLVSKAVYAAVANPSRTFTRPAEILHTAAQPALALSAVTKVTIAARLPRALLQADCVEYSHAFSRDLSPSDCSPSCTVRGLRVSCIIGLHPHERAERQRLVVHVAVHGYNANAWSHKALADHSFSWLDNSQFGTLESLADSFARYLLSLPLLSGPHTKVDVIIEKPSALPFATPSIRVSRNAAAFRDRGGVHLGGTGSSATVAPDKPALRPAASQPTPTRVFVAVGSNVGDRVGHIRQAVRALQKAGCMLCDTSRLYESEPMYVEEQDRFLNGVVEFTTTLSPIDLLRLLKRTESEIGRTKTFRNGPRVIDLDLALYGDEIVRIGTVGDQADEDGVAWLEVPHAALAEREFVLRPLAECVSMTGGEANTSIDPVLTPPGLPTVAEMLKNVAPGGLEPVIPFPLPAQPLRLSNPSSPAIMAIFNATPDSFSDGDETRTKLETALRACEETAGLPNPPSIIDIGGMSTRPGSEPCSEQDELDRVIPLVEAARTSRSRLSVLPLSVDTYRPSVARAAVAAGASCINDVRGGSEQGMLSVMAQADVPVVLMHSRGDSTTMLDKKQQLYADGVIAGVRAELSASVRAAKAAGVKRWDIILDPGLGFAKSHDDHLRLLRGISKVTSGDLKGYPLLVGASRKGFVGRVTGKQIAAERGPGDAAVNAWCVQSCAVDILRVHDPQAAWETVAMAKAIRDAE